jgi:hypothetical protein
MGRLYLIWAAVFCPALLAGVGADFSSLDCQQFIQNFPSGDHGQFGERAARVHWLVEQSNLLRTQSQSIGELAGGSPITFEQKAGMENLLGPKGGWSPARLGELNIIWLALSALAEFRAVFFSELALGQVPMELELGEFSANHVVEAYNKAAERVGSKGFWVPSNDPELFHRSWGQLQRYDLPRGVAHEVSANLRFAKDLGIKHSLLFETVVGRLEAF